MSEHGAIAVVALIDVAMADERLANVEEGGIVAAREQIYCVGWMCVEG
jgi:hypothetical protein